jgi:6-pyruvoyl-tetrahydropterin synthase
VFTVEVRDHIMIAHSFRGDVFGPAQALHGATFVIDAAFIADTVDANGIVIDIGRAHDALKAALKPLNYANLDDVPEFKGKNTTTEFLTKHIFDSWRRPRARGELGRAAASSRRSASPSGIACGARVLRGAVVVKRVRVRGAGDLATPTGGYAYDRRMIAELQKLGWQVDVIGSARLSPAGAETKGRRQTRLAGAPKECPIVIDGLGLRRAAGSARELRERNPLIALVHHPLALETVSRPPTRSVEDSEREALAARARRVVTSPRPRRC